MMAKLGKGILGAPTGVIGNVMCYNRLGKSIIQSRSYPVDAYKRRWNLLKSQTVTLATELWGVLLGWQRNTFAVYVLGSETLFEAYLRLCLAQMFRYKLGSPMSFIISEVAALRIPVVHFVPNNALRSLVVDIPRVSPFWQDSGNIGLFFVQYSESSFLSAFVIYFPYSAYKAYSLNLTSYLHPAAKYITLRPTRDNQARVYTSFFTGLVLS